ncbi:hypothetical protein H8356DRAFT_1433765 [Neocallimastix lanati (nom. inval.)]|nr:hypothetical protein H8356DRAFT_1433765 [Neocallimastix sp. JGI-2020a]
MNVSQTTYILDYLAFYRNLDFIFHYPYHNNNYLEVPSSCSSGIISDLYLAIYVLSGIRLVSQSFFHFIIDRDHLNAFSCRLFSYFIVDRVVLDDNRNRIYVLLIDNTYDDEILLTFHLTLDKSSNINDRLIVNYIATILDSLWKNPLCNTANGNKREDQARNAVELRRAVEISWETFFYVNTTASSTLGGVIRYFKSFYINKAIQKYQVGVVNAIRSQKIHHNMNVLVVQDNNNIFLL